ncbi:hypothetical protein AVL63_02970 [Nesterenkonia jeotgali]|uniref:Uncharacterized protein n=2 Tax=Nesterenkonia jeotgali TaxID=317018 RepID=A0A0W8IGH7_9MICC|nr:hypothetical protein AVL63_02970 [Nesterenkonia jeotgali]
MIAGRLYEFDSSAREFGPERDVVSGEQEELAKLVNVRAIDGSLLHSPAHMEIYIHGASWDEPRPLD